MAICPVLYELRLAGVGRRLSPSSGNNAAIRIDSEPRGASIYVDYRFRGVAPIEVSPGSGDHLVEARLQGYSDEALLIPAGARTVLLRLKPAPSGTLKVESEPSAAQVYIDRVFAGFTPLETKLPPGRHLVEIEKANRVPVQEWVAVQSDGTLVVSHKLPDRVLEYLLAASRANPDAVDVFMELAHYYFIQDRLDDAASAYRQAVLNSYNPDIPREDVGRLEKQMKVHRRWPGKELKAFNSALDAAVAEAARRFPASIKALRAKSMELEQRRDMDGALAVWREGIKAAPANPAIWLEFARLAMRARKNDDAVLAFEKIVELADGDPEMLRQAVQTIHGYFRTFPVKEERDRFLEIALGRLISPVIDAPGTPENTRTEFLYCRAMTREYLDDHDNAVNDYISAINAQKEPAMRVEWRERLAILLIRANRKDEAMEQYRRALEEVREPNRRTVIERRLEQLEKYGR
ncbi:MAG TPA: PEGA domain-containing protein [Planctomycetes bacterium]|nr:PEGA domain-containing protein [Planctomycetota bacterium]